MYNNFDPVDILEHCGSLIVDSDCNVAAYTIIESAIAHLLGWRVYPETWGTVDMYLDEIGDNDAR